MSNFVKLDCGILESSLWGQRDTRDIFLTALLMAEPMDTITPLPQIAVRSLDLTGWSVPPGWYGIVRAASAGIIRRSLVEDQDAGLAALEELGEPDPCSRSADYEGRRLVRVDGGYLVLNWEKYRTKDYTSAARSKRWRDKQKLAKEEAERHAVSQRSGTQADADADAEAAGLHGMPLHARTPYQEQNGEGVRTADAMAQAVRTATGGNHDE